ncbi:unnamed protein product [Lactuca virosa]|uniref:Nuclear pore complex protein NUP98A n=1 Tax=Lactuca virosa TaxID=75947 RepID=A0AAU9PST6_9ASTR|nr:unnamed protein product [Lactuca virosa]
MFGSSNSVFCGSSSPSFGASSTPAFGASSSGFDCKSLSSQKPSVFGSTTPTQPTFGSNLFGSTQFGASSQPSFSTPSTPTFWSSTTPAFGATSASASGSTSSPAFGSSPFGATSAAGFGATSTPAFGSSPFGATSAAAFGATSASASRSTSSPAFGSSPFCATSAAAFGATSASAFESTSTPAFGSSSFGATSASGSPSTPAFGNSPFGATSAAAFGSSSFGATSASAFGSKSTPAFGSSPFGATSLPFSFWSSPVSGQSTSAFGNATSPLGVQSSPFGVKATTPAFGSCGFGQTSFGGQRGGSRVTPYAQTPEENNGGGTHPAVKFQSISAMPAFKEKSHEELRWEDYQQGDKGCPNLIGFNNTQLKAKSFPLKSSTFTTPGFGTTGSTFGSFPFGASSTPVSSATSAFGSSPFATATSPFGAQSSPFGGQATTPAFGSCGFGQTSFGGRRGGSRVTPYAQTPEENNGGGTHPAVKFQSISAMPAYKDKSHEELRWEDYQQGHKGCPNPISQTSGGMGFSNTQSNPFSSSPSLGQTSSCFGQSARLFAKSQRASSVFGQSMSAFGGSLCDTSMSPFGVEATQPALGGSGFGQTSFRGQRGGSRVTHYAQTPEENNGGGTHSAVKFQSISAMPTYEDKSHEELRWEDYQQGDKGGPNPIGGMGFNITQSNPFTFPPAFTQASSLFGQTAPSFGQGTPAFGQSNAFGGNLGFNQTTPFISMPFQLVAQPTQNSSGFGFGTPTGGIGGTLSVFSQNNLVCFFACLSIKEQ